MDKEDFIITNEVEDLFKSSEKIKDDFDPPPLLNETNILDQTPTIKFLTPVRKKSRPRERENFEEESSFNQPEQMPFANVMTPEVDLTDDDEVNERVRFLINNPSLVNYENEPDIIKELCMETFRTKFQSLIINYPEYKIEFPEDKSLTKIHKFYHELIKSIYVNLNLSQYETYYILGLFVIEYVMVKIFGLPMAGFTKMELKRMSRYNSLLVELGESFYPTGYGEKSSIEWRIASSMLWNIFIFLSIKIISSLVGGEDMVELFRKVADKLMDTPYTKDNIESGEARNIESDNGNLIDDILGGGMGGMGDFKNIISDLGTKYTETLESGKKSSSKKRVIFES